MPRPLLDLAVLVTARAYDVQYAWTLAEPAAVGNGLDPAVIDAVRNRGPVEGLSDREAALIAFGRELFGPHTVSPETYANAVGAVGGTTNLVDLVDLMAQHVSDATLLIAFDQHLPADRLPLLANAVGRAAGFRGNRRVSVYRPLFRELNASGTRYVVVGGVATVLHGYTRLTADVDLMIDLEQRGGEGGRSRPGRFRPSAAGSRERGGFRG